MIALAIALACVAAYLWVGWRYIGPRYVVRQVNARVLDWTGDGLEVSAKRVADWRKQASGEAWGPAIVWPVCLLAWLLSGRLAIRAPLTDFEARQQAAAQAARIADLERQLGIGS
jgi:hypothetical protein